MGRIEQGTSVGFKPPEGCIGDVTSIEFLDKKRHLTREMIQITQDSYEEYWEVYKNKYEWHTDAIRRAKEEYFKFFVSQIPSNEVNTNILVAGCGSGRDVNQALLEGFNVIGVDTSKNMVNSTHELASGAVVHNSDIREMNFASKSLKGILMESAAQHIPKKEIFNLLNKFSNWLAGGGIMLVRFKIADTGEILRTMDDIGERYYSTFTMSEIERLKEAIPDDLEFVGEKINNHVDENKPPFLSLVFRKKITNKY